MRLVMKLETFVPVAKLSELNGAGPFALSANGVDVVVARDEGRWRAFGGRCPHQGALLGEGELAGRALVCRNHHWRFALNSGQRIGGPEALAACPVAERNGALWVDVAGLAPSARRTAATRSLDDLPGPRPLPVIGNLHQLDSAKAHLTMEAWAARYGSTFQFRMGPRRVVATTDPALIDEVLRARPEAFRRPEHMDRVISELGVNGVFNAEGDVWRPQRKLSVSALAQRHLHQVFPSIQLVAERLNSRWQKAANLGETLDVIEDLKRFTVDVTMLIVFGHDANTVEQEGDVIQSEFEVFLPAISRRFFALIPTWRYFQTPSDRRVRRAVANVRAWLGGVLAEARTRLQSEPERAAKPSNFVEAMVTTRDENGEPFSDDVIMSNLLTMLIAGEDTTSVTLAWAIHQLCDSPRWASEIRREADTFVGASIAPASHDVATQLVCAGAVAAETMRLRPVAPIIFHDAAAETSLGGYIVPKGTIVAALLRSVAIDPANFADPLAFRPERWLDDASRPRNLSVSMPFGSGPRMCPGRPLALLEMKTLLSMLYKNFDVDRAGDAADVSELYGFTMSPRGLRVRLRSRRR